MHAVPSQADRLIYIGNGERGYAALLQGLCDHAVAVAVGVRLYNRHDFRLCAKRAANLL